VYDNPIDRTVAASWWTACSQLGRGTVTLLYGSKEARFNNATALREYLEA